jgi:hypothetical protein
LAALQRAHPLPHLLLSGLPNLMHGYSQGLLGAAAGGGGEGPAEALASSLLPALGSDKSQSWVVGNHTLWYAPPKPLLGWKNKCGLFLHGGTWGGLTEGARHVVTATLLAPCGPQQQQQQQEEEEDMDMDMNMPGSWRSVASERGHVSCVPPKQKVKFTSGRLRQHVQPLLTDHFLLRAHYSQVGSGCQVSRWQLRVSP